MAWHGMGEGRGLAWHIGIGLPWHVAVLGCALHMSGRVLSASLA